jgi:hypothetical protein
MAINTPKGWVTDVHPVEQPDNTYRYALNAVREVDGGDKTLIINEKGTVSCVSLPSEPIGQVFISDNSFVVFLSGNEIGLVKDCTYTSVLKDECLNFSPTYPVDAIFRVRGCDTHVYYTDGFNPPRVVNLSDPKCELLIPSDTPIQATATVVAGGSLTQGSYQVAIRYMDSNQNPSNWSFFAGPYVVYSGTTFSTANGEYNPASRPEDGIPSSGKSIRVSVQSDDKPLYQVALAISTSSSGSIDTVYLSRPTPIAGNIIADGNFSSWTVGLIEDIFVDRITISKAKHIEQIENRLVLANITETERKYCSYQSYANSIVTKPIVRSVPTVSLTEGNARHYDQSQAGYMADDVYMFGIVYVFDDGSQSPVFHIPGRSKIADDTVLDVVITATTPQQISASEVAHLGLEPGDQVESWRVRNSGTADRFGYWEGNDLYPMDTDCDGNLVWGSLAGQPIRGHRFPSRDVVPLVDYTEAFVLGVNFDNVTYPEPDIIGHFFVRVKTNNPTVVDTAYLLPTYTNPAVEGGNELSVGDMLYYTQELYGSSITNSQSVYAVTPKTLFNLPLSYEYISQYRTVRHDGGRGQETIEDVIAFGTDPDFTTNFYYARADNESYPVPYRNYGLVDNFRLDPRIESNVGVQRYKNYSNTIPYEVARLNSAMDVQYFGDGMQSNNQTISMIYSAMKSTVDPFPSLSNFSYVRISPFSSLTSLNVYGGDTFVSAVSVFNVADVELRRNLFNAIRQVTWKGTLLAFLYFESRFNTSLNYRTDDYFEPSMGTLGLPQMSIADGQRFLQSYALNLNDDGDRVLRELGEYIYDFNDDMSVVYRLKDYFPLPALYDCCKSCMGRSPFRMIYSQQSFQEEDADNYRVFLPNNYRDIEGHTGEIKDIQRSGKDLLVVTVDALWYLPSNVQERVSDAGIVSYLGSGEFFSLPPRIIIEQLGNADKFATISTPAGVVLMDTLYGRLYFVTDRPQQVDGIESELRRVMGRTLADTFGIPASYRIGTIAAFDDAYRRVIITHKDYKPLAPIGGTTQGRTGTQVGSIYYDTDSSSFYTVIEGFGAIDISLDSAQFFCNRSFTVSFSLDYGWVGYHSYKPQIYFAGKNLLMSVNNNHLHKNNAGDYCVYYGNEYPHSLEQVFKTKGVDSVSFVTYATENGYQKRWTTWDRVVVYNSHQATMERSLISKDNIEGEYYMQNSAILSYLLDTYEEVFRINGFRDEVGNYDVPLFIEECIDLAMGNKMLNPLAFTGKEWYDKQPFMDNYVQVRFLFSPHPKTRLASVIFIATDEKGRDRGKRGSNDA